MTLSPEIYGSLLVINLQAGNNCPSPLNFTIRLPTYDQSAKKSRQVARTAIGDNTFTFVISIDCAPNFYGTDCKAQCQSSVAQTGSCTVKGKLSCNSGFFGKSCANQTLTTALTAAFALLFLVSVGIIAWIIYNRRSSNNSGGNNRVTPLARPTISRPEPTGGTGIPLGTLPADSQPLAAGNAFNTLPNFPFRNRNQPPPVPPKNFGQQNVDRDSEIYDDIANSM